MTPTERLIRITALLNSIIEPPSDSAIDDAMDDLRELIKPFPASDQETMINTFWIFADGA